MHHKYHMRCSKYCRLSGMHAGPLRSCWVEFFEFSLRTGHTTPRSSFLPNSSSRTSLSPSVVTNPQHNTLKISQDGNRPRPPPCSRRAPQYVIPRRVGAAMRWRQLSFRRNMKPSREERLTSIQRSLSPPTPTSGCWCACTSSWLVSTPTENAHVVCANSGQAVPMPTSTRPFCDAS